MSNEARHTAEQSQAGLTKSRGALRERELALIPYVRDVAIEEVERLSRR